MNETKFTKEQIATQQLKTAVGLFLSKVCYSSAITLAGASDGILSQLVINKGEKPFVDFAREVHDKLFGSTPKRGSYNHHIEKKFGIIAHKHMSENCSDTVEIDIPKCAQDAITKAVINYTLLFGESEPFIRSFLQWLWENADGEELYERYKLLPKNADGEVLSSTFNQASTKQDIHLEKHKVLDLAQSQLEAAVGLFVSGHDRFSVITLAGAADTLLCTLVTNMGEESFTKQLLQEEKGTPNKTIAEFGREINDIFHINALKHMDPDDVDFVIMDQEESAIGAILKALANYVSIRGKREDFVQAFLFWVKQNLDPEKYNVDCDPEWQSTE